MSVDSILAAFDAFRGPLIALAAGLAWAGLMAALRRPGLASLGLPVALIAGAIAVMGPVTASPRQLPERVPGLALALLLLALPLVLAPKRPVMAALGAVAALFTGWWVAGAPLHGADAVRAAPVFVTMALLAGLLLLEARDRWRCLLAAVALAAALWASGVVGPWLMLGLVLAAAAVALAVGPGPAAWLAFAPMLALLAAGPVLARGAPADWMALATPLCALLIGGRLAAGAKGGRAWAWLIPSAVLPVALTWGLARLAP
ncbi:MAG: hypothetical protein K2X11_06440 [Acetobacteraceae bacterium]|nr:hypothetical protein [Acetobacteraceae bacterium]